MSRVLREGAMWISGEGYHGERGHYEQRLLAYAKNRIKLTLLEQSGEESDRK